jgi:hypothetical protein
MAKLKYTGLKSQDQVNEALAETGLPLAAGKMRVSDEHRIAGTKVIFTSLGTAALTKSKKESMYQTLEVTDENGKQREILCSEIHPAGTEIVCIVRENDEGQFSYEMQPIGKTQNKTQNSKLKTQNKAEKVSEVGA